MDGRAQEEIYLLHLHAQLFVVTADKCQLNFVMMDLTMGMDVH